MIIVAYIIIAAALIFALCVAKSKVIKSRFMDIDYFWPPIVAGALWPIGAPMYAAYLGAVWFIYNSSPD